MAGNKSQEKKKGLTDCKRSLTISLAIANFTLEKKGVYMWQEIYKEIVDFLKNLLH